LPNDDNVDNNDDDDRDSVHTDLAVFTIIFIYYTKYTTVCLRKKRGVELFAITSSTVTQF